MTVITGDGGSLLLVHGEREPILSHSHPLSFFLSILSRVSCGRRHEEADEEGSNGPLGGQRGGGRGGGQRREEAEGNGSDGGRRDDGLFSDAFSSVGPVASISSFLLCTSPQIPTSCGRRRRRRGGRTWGAQTVPAAATSGHQHVPDRDGEHEQLVGLQGMHHDIYIRLPTECPQITCSSTFTRAAVITFFHSLGETGLQTALLYFLKAQFHYTKNQYANLLLIFGITGSFSQLTMMPLLAPKLGEQRLLSLFGYIFYRNRALQMWRCDLKCLGLVVGETYTGIQRLASVHEVSMVAYGMLQVNGSPRLLEVLIAWFQRWECLTQIQGGDKQPSKFLPWLQNIKKTPNVNFGETVKARLQKFSVMYKFKKHALRVIVEYLSVEELLA